MTDEELLVSLKANITGNRTKDRVFLVDAYKIALKNQFSAPVLQFLEKSIDASLPVSDKRFTKDMKDDQEFWINFLFSQALGYGEKVEAERALVYMNFLINETENESPRKFDNKNTYFYFNEPLEEQLLVNILNFRQQVRYAEYNYAAFYHLYARILFDLDREMEAIGFLGVANSWNPTDAAIMFDICYFYKEKKVADRLLFLAQWMMHFVFDKESIGDGLRLVGYGYFLNGKYERAYACYYESLRYGGDTHGSSAEIKAILQAMNVHDTYDISKRELNELFLGEKFVPGPSIQGFNTLKSTAKKMYEAEEYADAIRYAEKYLILKNDSSLVKLVARAKLHLN